MYRRESRRKSLASGGRGLARPRRGGRARGGARVRPLAQLDLDPERPVVREADAFVHAGGDGVEAAQPEPVELEFEDEGFPGRLVVGQRRLEALAREEAAGGLHVLPLDGVEVAEDDGALDLREEPQ